MNNHTPGPWIIEETSDHDADYRVMDEQEVTVCLCYQQPEDTWLANDNAHLIASAPDLLAALQSITELVKESGFQSPMTEEHFDDVYSAARAAIAKATPT